MESIVAGWDGGGTKTRVTCLSLTGEKRGTAEFGALNPNGASETDVLQTVADALEHVRSQGECKYLVVSTAGVSNPDVERLIRRALTACGYTGALELAGDQQSALYGAVGAHGAVLIAGTGSICYGRSQSGQTARSGGYGYLVDDEGSGYAIGRDILSAVLRDMDGRGQPTRLRALLTAQEGFADVPDIMRSLYTERFQKAHIAALAPLLIKAGDDPVAQAIAQRAAKELVLLAATVIDRLALGQSRLAFMGSILTHYPLIRSAVTQALTARYPKLAGFDPLADAAHGAALMALDGLRRSQ